MPDPTHSRFALLFTAMAIAALAGCSRTSVETSGTSKAVAAPEKEVGTVTLKHETLAQSTELPGRTAAPVIAEIRPQVGGILKERLFTEGSQVKAGQVLYQLDPAPLQAAHASAQAGVRKAESALATARTVARRNAELVKIDAISRQVFDESQATEQQAEADLGVARAAEQTARIQLGYTRITSPIAGWAELSTVTPGALVTANQTAVLTTVQQLDPIHVHVTQSSRELLRLKRELASGRLQRASDAEARIQLVLEDGSKYPHAGRLTFSGVTVDAGTGSVTLRAVVPNPDKLLMPGMYVRAVLQEGTDATALLVPQQAVTRAPDGSASALVVDAENKVAKRPIQVGRAVGTRWQVLEGLAAGDRVMTEGAQRVKVGDKVKVVDLGAKAASPASGPVASVQPDAADAASGPVAR
ncbi:efflux RND transporter periplasmic adaptor subunit [Variovorax sp.]|uniref:efflux RND transporter periplasmic adaptor subunit n=1 Tax=Variovorax sp. TaxID=1871043 RepID=UPI003BAD95E4